MNDLMELLYSYAMEHTKINDPTYKETEARAERHLETLENSLTAAQKTDLEALCDMNIELEAVRLKAMFQTALAMGIYLGNLYRA